MAIKFQDVTPPAGAEPPPAPGRAGDDAAARASRPERTPEDPALAEAPAPEDPSASPEDPAPDPADAAPAGAPALPGFEPGAKPKPRRRAARPFWGFG